MYWFTVKDTSEVAPDTLLITLAPKSDRDRLQFSSGQYAAIGFKRFGRPSPMRCFSIVSSPNNPDEVQFAMRVRGNFTRAIAGLKIGTPVFVRGPFGNFVFDSAHDQDIVLLAGGIGVTPFISMIRHASEAALQTPITLLYSCGSQDDIPFYQELLELERVNARFRVYFFITRGAIEKLRPDKALTGYIDEARLSQLTKGQFSRFSHFICGPTSFMRAVESTLANHSAPPIRVLTEEFTPTTQLSETLAPQTSASRWTYGLSAASLALGFAFIMFLDLDHAVPRLVSADEATRTLVTNKPAALATPDATTSATPAPATSTTTPSTATSTPSDNTVVTPSATTSPAANTTTTSATPSATAQPTPSTYQQPVTSVS